MNYVGLDVSGKSVVAVWKDGDGKTIRQETITNTEDELRKLAASLEGCKVAVESSTSGLFVYRCLSASKVQMVMANPAKIRLISQSDKKTDKNDAAILADLLRVNMLPTSYVPPETIRVLRDLIRHRASLVQATTRFKNRLRAVLAAEGLQCSYDDIFSKSARIWLKQASLAEHNARYVQQLLHLGEEVKLEIRKFDAEIKIAYSESKEAALLDTMPGIAKHSAVVILSEIGDIHRFDSPKKLCSYAGLVPTVYQSGETCRMGHIKQGNSILRTILVQDAHSAANNSRRFMKFYNKVKRKKGAQKAVIAVAHKMLVIIWHMLQKGKPFEEAAICHTRRAAA